MEKSTLTAERVLGWFVKNDTSPKYAPFYKVFKIVLVLPIKRSISPCCTKNKECSTTSFSLSSKIISSGIVILSYKTRVMS